MKRLARAVLGVGLLGLVAWEMGSAVTLAQARRGHPGPQARRGHPGPQAAAPLTAESPGEGPSGDPADDPAAAGAVLLRVTDDGIFILAGEAFAVDASVLARLTVLHEQSPTVRLHVRAGAPTLHGRLVRALDLVREAGIDFANVSVERA